MEKTKHLVFNKLLKTFQQPTEEQPNYHIEIIKKTRRKMFD